MNDKSILVVDDNLKNIQVLGAILKEQNYKLFVATSGEDALSLLSEKDIDLVLLDVMMPGMDGYETCLKIRSQSGFLLLPVIFITAKTDKKDIVKGFKAGGMDYIAKPFQTEELLARIQTHLELFQMRKDFANANRQLRDANEKLTLASFTDPLTGLWNRRYMIKRIEDEISRSYRTERKFSLVMGDIDFFKRINDNFGHLAGDRILVLFSNIMNEVCRKHDVVSRWGGEEFLILLPDTEIDGAMKMAEKLKGRIESSCLKHEDKDITFTASFGIAETLGAEGIDQIINKSDMALYQSKEHGRNRSTCITSESEEVQEI